MPAKRKIQKEDILKASISIISHEGLNALNARKLAKKLGYSTQPLTEILESTIFALPKKNQNYLSLCLIMI